MPLEYCERYTRKLIQANRHKTYIFGDNLMRAGLGGQAQAARYEPNTIGIPTKRGPYAMFSDKDYDEWLKAAQPLFDKAEGILLEGKILVYPVHGIGTGLARLPSVAPRIMARIKEWVTRLEEISNS